MSRVVVEKNKSEMLEMIKDGKSANQIKRHFNFSEIKNIKTLAAEYGLLDQLIASGKRRQFEGGKFRPRDH